MFSNLSGRQGMSIFNRRRRPRQAVYASPQSQSVNTTTSITEEVPDDQLVSMAQDFESGPGNYAFISNQKPTTRFNKTPNTRPVQARNYAPQKHPNNQFNNENIQPKLENHYLGGRTSSGPYSGGQQQQSMDTEPNRYTSGNNFQNRQQNSASREFHFNSNSLNQQSDQHQPFHNTPAKATTAVGIARQPAENAKACIGATQNQYNKIKMEKPMNLVSKIGTSGETFSLKTVDKSMKFVTSTIQGMRKWTEHREQIPLVFEIFATLDSVPTSNNNGTAKLFSIKDTTGTIRCIYWEMDQKLPRVARGQTYRLTGAINRRTGHFQCFTIRQAQPAEQRFAPKQVALCDSALTKVVSMIAEA